MEFLIVVWCIFAFAVAYVAKQRGRDNAMWFALSLVISPLLAMLALIAMPDLKAIAAEEKRRRDAEDAAQNRHDELIAALRGLRQ